MRYSFITIILTLLTLASHTYARKPAVEDTYTVISADYNVVPKGMEAPINFTNKIPTLGKMDTQDKPSNTVVALLGLLAMICLPALMWFGITKTQAPRTEEQVSDEEASNVSQLDDYRKDKDHTDKKAS